MNDLSKLKVGDKAMELNMGACTIVTIEKVSGLLITASGATYGMISGKHVNSDHCWIEVFNQKKYNNYLANQARYFLNYVNWQTVDVEIILKVIRLFPGGAKTTRRTHVCTT